MLDISDGGYTLMSIYIDEYTHGFLGDVVIGADCACDIPDRIFLHRSIRLRISASMNPQA